MKQKKKSGYTFRKLINDLHLWLGVGSSIILFLVCLSGTLYTFKPEIEKIIEPEKFYIENIGEQKFSFKEIIQETEEKSGGKVTRISYYDNLHKPYELQVSKSKEDRRGETHYVNPYTNEILGTGKGPLSEFFLTMFKLHRWLLLDQEIGRPIVGVATLIFVFLTMSGLILWLPKKIKGLKSFKPGLKIKFSANWKRINHDLHNVLGFYTFLLVLIMALTGLCWSFEWYKDGLSNVLGAKVFGDRDAKKPESTIIENGKKLSVEEIAAIGDSAFPYTGKTIIGLAKGPEGSFELSKKNDAIFNKDASDKITIDQYSGAIIKKDVFAEKKYGQKIAAQIRAIHMGEIYGTWSKVIYFLSCLIATSLPITGIFIWINKMKKNKKTK